VASSPAPGVAGGAEAPPREVAAIPAVEAAPVPVAEEAGIPRPVGRSVLELPRRLLRRPARGMIVLLLELGRAGEVLDLEIASSDLPEFEEVVLRQVREWKFSPFTRQGRPVEARARLPIPIQIN
jgi:TonB family protein